MRVSCACHSCARWLAGLPEDAGAELQAAAAALLAGVAAGACAEQQHCKGMPGDAHRAMDTAKSGANPNPKNPKTPEAIALERCARSSPPAKASRTQLPDMACYV